MSPRAARAMGVRQGRTCAVPPRALGVAFVASLACTGCGGGDTGTSAGTPAVTVAAPAPAATSTAQAPPAAQPPVQDANSAACKVLSPGAAATAAGHSAKLSSQTATSCVYNAGSKSIAVTLSPATDALRRALQQSRGTRQPIAGVGELAVYQPPTPGIASASMTVVKGDRSAYIVVTVPPTQRGSLRRLTIRAGRAAAAGM